MSQSSRSNPEAMFTTHGQATSTFAHLCQGGATQICSFHITWIAFYLCFFVWFCTANIYSSISADPDLNISLYDHQLAGTMSITSTIIFRVLISSLCSKYGSRICYVIVLLSTSLTLISLSLFVHTSCGYILCHFFLGIAGASFVITEYHTTQMFSSSVIGFAQAITAGFGNFGGGCANVIMPLILYYTNCSWRTFLLILAAALIILSLIYYFGTDDNPNRYHSNLANVHSDDIDSQSEGVDSQSDENCESFMRNVHDYRIWILFLCYWGCFGVELTFYLVAASYFQSEYEFDEIQSGLLVLIWSSMNLFSRPLGGYFADQYNLIKKVRLLCIVLFAQSIFIILFGVLSNTSLIGAVLLMLLFSICVQMAEGVTFSIVTVIQPQSIANVIGIVGAGGNFGAAMFMFTLFLPSNGNNRYSWIILGSVVMIFSLSALFIKFSGKEMDKCNSNKNISINTFELLDNDSNSSNDIKNVVVV